MTTSQQLLDELNMLVMRNHTCADNVRLRTCGPTLGHIRAAVGRIAALKQECETLKDDLVEAIDMASISIDTTVQPHCCPYYEPPRPARGTPDYKEWRTWKNSCGIWVDAQGRCTPITDMRDIHLENAIKYLSGQTGSYYLSRIVFPVLDQLTREAHRRGLQSSQY